MLSGRSALVVAESKSKSCASSIHTTRFLDREVSTNTKRMTSTFFNPNGLVLPYSLHSPYRAGGGIRKVDALAV